MPLTLVLNAANILTFLIADDVLLAGDLFTSKKGRLHRPMPMFTSNMEGAINSAEIVRKLKPHRLEITHGNPVFQPADHLDEYISKNLKIYEKKNAHQVN